MRYKRYSPKVIRDYIDLENGVDIILNKQIQIWRDLTLMIGLSSSYKLSLNFVLLLTYNLQRHGFGYGISYIGAKNHNPVLSIVRSAGKSNSNYPISLGDVGF